MKSIFLLTIFNNNYKSYNKQLKTNLRGVSKFIIEDIYWYV